MNAGNVITGYYISRTGASHGFVRDQDGRITEFDAPGSSFTEPVNINDAGEITGTFESTSDPGTHGFIRNSHGKMTAFGTKLCNDCPRLYAQPVHINVTGEVVGNFADPAGIPYVFVRSRFGEVSWFSLSDGADYPTVATGLNNSGAIIGYSSSDSLGFSGGFFYSGQRSSAQLQYRRVYGDFCRRKPGNFSNHINELEEVVGCYSIGTALSNQSPTFYDFVWEQDGTVTTLQVPGIVPSIDQAWRALNELLPGEK